MGQGSNCFAMVPGTRCPMPDTRGASGSPGADSKDAAWQPKVDDRWRCMRAALGASVHRRAWPDSDQAMHCLFGDNTRMSVTDFSMPVFSAPPTANRLSVAPMMDCADRT